MLNKRKTFSILLVAVLLVSVLSVFVLAQNTVASLTPASQTIAIGDTTTVTLHVQDVENLYGYQATVAFDPGVLEVVDANKAGPGIQVALGSWLQPDFVQRNSADNSLGTVECVVSQISPHPAVSGSGALFTITFRGKAPGLSQIRFSDLMLARADGTGIQASQQDAQVNVREAIVPTATPTPTPLPVEPTPTVPTPTWPAPGTTLILQVLDPGDRPTVQVWVSDVANFYGIEFELAFDSSIIQALDVQAGTAFTDHPDQYEVVQNSVLSGRVQFAAALLRVAKAPPLSGNLHLATIPFERVGCGTSPLTWVEAKLSDNNGGAIPHTAIDGRVEIVCPTATVTGRASMQGRERNAHSGGIVVTLSDHTPTSTTTDASGWYTFAGVPVGVYDLAMSHRLYLTAHLHDCPVKAGETAWMPDVELLGGDLDGNGVINISDLTAGGSCFNDPTAACLQKADINDDSQVDIFDIVLIGRNFGLTGPYVYTCAP